MLRGTQEYFVLNEYSRSYLEEHQLAASHLAKLQNEAAPTLSAVLH